MSGEGIDWRRISRGTFWIGLGTFLLLNTSGVIPWSFWIDALAYWPVLLVAAGIRLIFERSGLPALVLLSPALVLGTLAWVASAGPRGPAGTWVDVEAPRSAESVEWSLEGDLAFARLDVRGGSLPPTLLADGRSASIHRSRLRVKGRDEKPRVQIGRRHRGVTILGLPSRREHWDLEVTDDLPMALDLNAAFAGGSVDLEQAPVSRVDLEGAFNSFSLRLGPAEEEVRIYLRGAFNDYRLRVPASTPGSSLPTNRGSGSTR